MAVFVLIHVGEGSCGQVGLVSRDQTFKQGILGFLASMSVSRMWHPDGSRPIAGTRLLCGHCKQPFRQRPVEQELVIIEPVWET
jgi:hypothetical protein